MKIYHNEIDPRCCEVLEQHFPDSVVDHRSIEDVKAEELADYPQCHFFAGIGGFSEAFRRAGIGADRNVWTGGFPCQDLSVAGKRKGLAGSRSGLYFTFQNLVAQCRPGLVIAENVPGLLSSNGGKDFAIVIGGFTGILPEVPADGWGNAGFFRGRVYSVAYRVLDAQYFGLAQRRRRVFIVASLGTGRAAEILFEREGVPGDTAPSREAGQETAAYAIRRAQTSSNGWGIDEAVNHTLDETGGDAVAIAKPLGGHHTRRDLDNETYVATFDPRNVTSKANRTRVDPNLPANTLHSEGLYCIAHGQANAEVLQGQSPTLSLQHEQPIVAFTERTRKDGRNFEVQDEVAYALTNPGNGGRTQSRQIAGDFGARRLTPVECERLQGFPDDWTKWGLLLGIKGGPQTDSVRYRQLGNAVAVPVVEWIARRI